MRVMVTGAAGFIGRLLVQRLLERGSVRGQPIKTLLILDQHLDGFADDPRLRRVTGSITDPALLRRSFADGIDVVFHLVSVPGGAAEQHYDMGHQVNLLASLEMLEQLRQSKRPPVFVYASSVAVYGADLPARMNEQSVTRPALSYGTHKLMVEAQIGDLGRRGDLDGRVLRLPGIVARPDDASGLRSAFMSNLMHALAEGRHFVCPVSAQATAWWMSARCCVDNLLHAAEIERPGDGCVWQLPLLQLSIERVVRALAKVFGEPRATLVSYQPDANLEALFGRFPPIRTPQAQAQGFRHDGTAELLVRNALDLLPRARRKPGISQSA